MERLRNEYVKENKVEMVSEDCFDFNRQDYDYMQIELLGENFKQAPPVSVAQYKARTSEILPQGIFDKHDVPGILIAGKGKPNLDYYSAVMPVDCLQENIIYNDDVSVETALHEDKPAVSFQRSAEKKISMKNGEIKNSSCVKSEKKIDIKIGEIKNNSCIKSENQKKKKKKFKQFDFQSSSAQNSKWTQPWTPDFSNKFKNDEEFPAL